MSRREFKFVDGSSRKFWKIEREGTAHTVHFGKIGTAGQAQTKEFASEAEAQKSYDKLIAEKLKKGYTELTAAAGAASTPMPAAKTKKKAEPAEEAAEPEESAATAQEPAAQSAVKKEKATPVPQIQTDVARRIDLDPVDWHAATWRNLAPKPRPAERPLDQAALYEQLPRIRAKGYGWDWDWELVTQSALTRQEARFWFEAMTECTVDVLTKERDRAGNYDASGVPKVLAHRLKQRNFDPAVGLTRDEAIARIVAANRMLQPELLWPLATLFPPAELLELLTSEYVFPECPHGWNADYLVQDLRTKTSEGFHQYVVPYASPEERETYRKLLRPLLAKVTPQASPWPVTIYLAASLGMGAEVKAFVDALPDDTYTPGSPHQRYDSSDAIQFLVFGLNDPHEVEAQMRRLKLKITSPEQLRSWLAHTEYAALDLGRDAVMNTEGGWTGGRNATAKERAEQMMKVFYLVKAPEAAPHMLELMLESKAPALARQWLDQEAGNAIAGLVETAAARGKLGEAAIDYFREAKKKGLSEIIRKSLEGASPAAAEKIKKEVLEHTEKEYAPLDEASSPAWLKEAVTAAGKGKSKVPEWARVTALPPLLVGDKRLSDSQTAAVLAGLQRSTFEKVDPLVSAVKEHAERASLDAFAWKLFQLWQSEGNPSKEKWAMGAVGYLGGDASVFRLTPLVRNWPGESQHQRAVFGLECLRAIGSDTALMALNGIAQKLKFKGLKEKAAAAMEEIAKAKGLSRSQLEDRIVPDCDLDQRGARVFDFGPRQFRFVLGPEMKPMLKDADGKLKTDLPKPGAKDDAKLAGEAVDAWKLMKKQIKEVANIQAQRLEQAMVTGRRWTVEDFETLLVRHPLMTNLVRLVVWGGYDQDGKLTTTFRVTEDQTYADQKDKAVKLAGVAAVGIVHALHLSDEERSAWGGVFGDYEIIPPFPQLGRTIFRLEKDEEKATHLLRYKGIKVPAPTLVFGLEKFGWVRGLGMDGGCFDEHSKQFPALGVTAVVQYEGSVGMGYIDPNENLSFEHSYFVPGLRPPGGFEREKNQLKLAEVDPVAVSEVLTDLSALAAKGK